MNGNLIFKNASLSDLFFVFLICSPVIGDILVGVFNISFGIAIPIILIFLMAWLFKKSKKISVLNVIMAVIFLMLFLFSFIRQGTNNILLDYFSYFLLYGVTPLLFIAENHNYERIFKYISIIGILAIVYYIYIGYDVLDFSENMRRSNLLLPCGLALVHRTIINNKDKMLIKMVFIVVLILYIYLLFMWGTRGSILAVFIFVLLLFIKRMNKLSRKLILASIIPTSVLLLLNFRNVITLIAITLNKSGVEFLWLNRTLLLLERNNLSNGRSFIWELAYRDIIEKPLLGLGISGFELKHGYYTHNIFVQFVVDYGFFIGIFFVFLIISLVLTTLLNSMKNNEDHYLLYLMVSSIVVLNFTSTIWYFPTFWLFLYESIRKQVNKKYEIILK